MDLRSAISILGNEITDFDENIGHEDLFKFIKENRLWQKPFTVNLDGKKLAQNFIASREHLCKYLGIRRENLAEFLSKIDYNGDIEIVEDNPLKKTNWTLKDLPIPKYFERDGGRYITAGVVIATRDEDDVNAYNACIHRLMVKSEGELVARLVPPRHTYLMWKDAVERSEDLKILIAVGCHPLFLFAASTRVPAGKEFGYASKLMNGLKLYRIDGLLTPMAEIVISARITGRKAEEGPFVDITGTYDKIRMEPVIEIDRIFARENPIFYSILPGGYEHQVLMGIPYEPVIFKAVSNVCRVKNVILTAGSRHYFHAIVQIEKVTEGDGKNAIISALSAHPSIKGVTVVDEDIDIYSHEDIEYAIATRFQADRDFVLIRGVRGSSLDPSSKEDGTTAKWGIDATKYLSRKDEFERVF
ncbi:UbiD family decarboxylase [Archaeoglobus sulfaticallidus PM70-1]|uniref:Anhydromevalonate phosphate decarboxylase n=1 Tax=Archaeoglobus sulfaticallidus PM70-1 TaxID=387631 RepID=N0BDJ1_9EURY|nr:UbiD family decarboxylase [Archaeoglobus sulfaticallidus]AGK61063.1 UbiD family decarboxylase [Archaeoglobus sulfaticallidus PM70-1]